MFRPSRLVPLKMAQIACYPPPDGTTAEVLAATAAAEAAMTWWIAFCTASTAQPPCEISSARASRPIPAVAVSNPSEPQTGRPPQPRRHLIPGQKVWAANGHEPEREGR